MPIEGNPGRHRHNIQAIAAPIRGIATRLDTRAQYPNLFQAKIIAINTLADVEATPINAILKNCIFRAIKAICWFDSPANIMDNAMKIVIVFSCDFP